MALAEQKRFAFKEQVTFFADASRTRPVFGFKARKVMDLNAGYDITDETGAPLGFFRKDFGASLLRSTFHLEGPGYQGTGQERNMARRPAAPVRRRLVPADPLRLRRHDGPPLVSVARQMSIGDRYTRHRARPSGRLPGRGAPWPSPRRPDGAAEPTVLHPQAARAPSRPHGPEPRSRPGFDVAAAPRRAGLAPPRSRPREAVAEVRRRSTPTGSRCRLYAPAGAPTGLVVHLHGGGFVLNDIDVHDASLRRLANRPAMAVLSVDYRRPPEHRVPGRTGRRLHGARLAGREGRPASASPRTPRFAHGDSAGANLALVAALRHPGRFAALSP